MLQDADPEHAEQEPTALGGFPLRREDLFAYNVVILGDVNPALLGSTALVDLAEFVRGRPRAGRWW